MSVNLATAYIELIPSMQGAQGRIADEMGGAGRTASRSFGGAFTGGLKSVIAPALTALGGLAIGGLISDSIGEAREAQKVGALTESIIKSTGGAAQVTAKHVGDLASAISLKAGVDDEAIQSGANLLLTFKNVRNEVGKGNQIFDRATQAAVDLSAAGFGDLSGQSKMLGKALNDPIKGISALSRSGVTFTEQQKEQIKTLVDSGRTLKAQKLILGEVESQVGGAAAATATEGEKAGVALGNLKEQIGTALLPVVDAAAGAFTTKLAPAISSTISFVQTNGPKAFSAFKTGVSGAMDAVRPAVEQVVGAVSSAVGGISTAVATVAPSASRLASALAPVGRLLATAAVATFVGAFRTLGVVLPPVGAAVSTVMDVISGLIESFDSPAVQGFAAAIGILALGAFGPLIASTVTSTVALVAWSVAGKAMAVAARVSAAAQWLLNAALTANPIGLVVAAIVVLVGALVLAYKKSDTFRAIVNRTFSAIKSAVLTSIKAVAAFITASWAKIKSVFTTTVAVIAAIVRTYFTLYRTIITTVLGAIRATVSRVWAAIRLAVTVALTVIRAVVGRQFAAIRAVVTTAWNVIRAVTVAVWAAIKAVISAQIAAASAVVSKAVALIKGYVRGLSVIGGYAKAAFQKLVDAVRDKVADAVGKVKELGGQVKSAVSGFGSLLYSAGAELVQGLINGITSKFAALASKAKELASKIKGLFPGSPVKEGPLTSWNNGGAGKRLVQMLADGMGQTKPVDDAARNLAARVTAPGFDVAATHVSSRTLGAATVASQGVGGFGRNPRFRLELDNGQTLTGVIREEIGAQRNLSEQRKRARY